jgi:hypothetical protein
VKKRKEGEEKKDGFAISGRGRFLPDNFTARAGEREREREREKFIEASSENKPLHIFN